MELEQSLAFLRISYKDVRNYCYIYACHPSYLQYIMKQKGITKRQFWIQTAPMALYIAMSVNWLVMGISEGSKFMWIMGAAFLALTISLIVYYAVLLKRHRIEDAQLDEQLTRSFKEGAKGAGIVFGIITLGFLIAFILVAILT